MPRGGKRRGAGRSSKLTVDQQIWVDGLCDTLARAELKAAQGALVRERLPEYFIQVEQAFSGSASDSPEARQRWLNMPVGRSHQRRVEEALLEDQGRLDEEGPPARIISPLVAVSLFKLEAKVKRMAKAEIKKQLGIDVHVRTISRIWDRDYRS